MKKFLVLAALALTAFAATDAEAVRYKAQQDIPWLAPNSAVPNGAFATQSGVKPLASETLDTTGVFTLRMADPRGFSLTSDGWNVADSVLIAYVVAYQDSSADGASTLTAATATIDASGDGWDWAVVGTSAVTATSDDPVVTFAIWAKGADHQNLLWTAPMLRIRFTSVTGLMVACRLKLVYMADSELEKREETVRWLAPDGAVPNGAFATTTNTKPLASEALDTLGVFTLFDAVPVVGDIGSANWSDSLCLGFLSVYTDSTADGASTLTAATATIDVSGDGWDWVTVGTVAGIAASDDPIVVFPLGAYLMGTTGDAAQENAILTNGLKVRVRFTAATGYLLAARAKLHYWKAKV